ncbi:MAG: aminopeptidase P family protein [Deferribacteres bacterium]|nr:aminopeptidase P family protein [candidate division KSB1 bacterium]MCB9504181.1 aminopeptidase P family protein [Deferribacteres bacterium]
MFSSKIYIDRRNALKKQFNSGLLLFMGNAEAPMNYPHNWYQFRQDGSFLYYWGIEQPDLAAVIDLDSGEEIIFGDELTVVDIVWMGQQATIAEKATKAGVSLTKPFNALTALLKNAVSRNRKIHYLPQYRADKAIYLADCLGVNVKTIDEGASTELILAVAAQRIVKSEEEIVEIEKALNVSYDMHVAVMREMIPGKKEYELKGMVEGIVASSNAKIAFPIILSKNGQILHNTTHFNTLKAGQIVVHDSGAVVESGYCSDITRTVPVSGKFDSRQKDIYTIVLNSQQKAFEMSRPGIFQKDVHLAACKEIVSGLKDLGLVNGSVDDAMEAGVFGFFMQCGLGHLMGLDVHDLEGLGESYVGYDKTVQRSTMFGLSSLRFGRQLQPGYVITVEPGIYFIPALFEMWKGEKTMADFINYNAVEKWLDFGGVRIEDDVVITEKGNKILGKHIPRSIDEVESIMAE